MLILNCSGCANASSGRAARAVATAENHYVRADIYN